MTTVLAWAKSIGYEFDTPRAEAAFVREVSEVGKNEGISQLLHNLVVNLKTPQNAQDTIDTIRLNKIRNCIASIDASDNLPVDDPQLLQKGSELEQQGTAIQTEIDRLEKELLNEQQDMIEIKTNISEIRQRSTLQIIHQCDQQANITEQELIGELVSHIEDGLNAVEQLETTFNKIAHTETQSARKRDIIMDSLGKGNFELVQTLAKMVDEANEITKETWWRRKENVQQQSQTQQCIVDNILSEINQSIKEKDCSKAFSEFFFGNNEEMESEQEDDLVGQKQEKNDGEQINHHVLSSVSSFDILPRITEQMKDEDLTNLISQQDDLQSERWVDEIEGVRKNAFQAVKYYDKLIKSINDWWNQPAQYALDSFRVDDLPLESWTQKWKQLSLELIRLINPARVGTSDLNQ
ncbi:MAG: hypothetical protein EZS28_008873 [Streblomastix strix]|uniref:Uncharacterized protein n=1 Tax=Streblomastix strix TaxID=222440 RepID=A0A5J4WKY6_9EUKA|nr:MAG: hypothetical protein EZS28_008873 [Streblomastix strix]